jgi:hypothetical protein
MSDTPKTDAAAMPIDRIDTIASRPCNVVHEDVCRQLERELAEAREERDRLAEAASILAEEYEDRRAQWGNEYLWKKHEDTERVNQALAAVKGGSHE